MAAAICGRLRFSRRETEQIVTLVEHHLRFKDAPRMKPSTLKRFLRLEGFQEHLELHRLDCLSSHRNLENYEYVCRALAELPPEAIRPQPLVTGDDLIAAGYTPGAWFKEILQAVEEAQLDSRIVSRPEAMEYVRERFPVPGGLAAGGKDHP